MKLQINGINDKTQHPAPVSSVQKALRILNCFTPASSELTLAQISSQLSIPKSTALNLIRTLEQCGYLIKSQSGQSYHLGYKILELSYSFRLSIPVVQYSIPYLEDIQEQTGEIVYLTSHVNGQVLYLESVYPSRRMANYSISGKTLPMHCTGCGKAMLSYLSCKELEQIVATWGLPRFTDNTITDIDSLRNELEIIRTRGYAIDLEEETPGVKCIAMPIRNAVGYPCAAISISGTVLNMKDDLLEKYAEILSRTCSALSSQASSFPAGQNVFYE